MQLSDQLNEILALAPYKLIVSNPKSKDQKYRKIEIDDKGGRFQAAQYTAKQVFHQNIPGEELADYLQEVIGEFSQLNAWSAEWVFELKVSKKGKVFLGKKKAEGVPAPVHEHNRKKNYILAEGEMIPPLVDMGIFTSEGRVVKSMYDKYKQINRFVELVDDVIRDRKMTRLTAIDFGCGKSYLTFILYYYLTEIRKLEVKMIGLDLKEEVIQNCNRTAQKYGYENLSFEQGDINGYQCDFPVDLVLTLHACDTATDYALHHAVEWGASLIFSVPCCQHELNSQIHTEKLSLLTKYGIVKERFSALATDAIRANLLESCGYSVQLLEFIDFSHTPKNILIRAVKKTGMSAAKKKRAYEEAHRVMEEFGFQPKLNNLLQNNRERDFQSQE